MVFALYGLGALAACSVLMSEMPRGVAWPVAAFAVGYGVRLGHVERRQPKQTLVWAPGTSPTIDGQALADVQLHWRGPIAFLRWRDCDGNVRRLAWWPDVLRISERRELRLAALDVADAAPAASMAP
jgi:toxin CptA